MINYKPAIYLAGPIRGIQDYEWRKQFVEEYKKELTFRVPFDSALIQTKSQPGFKPGGYMAYRMDLDLVDRSDMVVANLLPMADGYPAIGTLFEIGYARAKGKLIFIVADEQRKQHPFLAFGADGLYPSFEELGKFLHQYLGTLNGSCPVFDQIKGDK
jgi:nucleoside 2-deoxyribosyltransferase